jgi:hypothetical protein
MPTSKGTRLYQRLNEEIRVLAQQMWVAPSYGPGAVTVISAMAWAVGPADPW